MLFICIIFVISLTRIPEDTKILHDERISEILCSPLPALVDDSKLISSPVNGWFIYIS